MPPRLVNLESVYPVIFDNDPVAYYRADDVNAELQKIEPLVEIGKRALAWRTAINEGRPTKEFTDAYFAFWSAVDTEYFSAKRKDEACRSRIRARLAELNNPGE